MPKLTLFTNVRKPATVVQANQSGKMQLGLFSSITPKQSSLEFQPGSTGYTVLNLFSEIFPVVADYSQLAILQGQLMDSFFNDLLDTTGNQLLDSTG